MLKPKQNKLVYRFFSWYVNRIIRKDFKAFNYSPVELDSDKAVLVLSNHFSWWDGFLIFQLNRLFIKKKFHVMVSEDNYKKVGFLKYMGAFSVPANSREVIESLRFAGKLLDNPENMLLIFPQGKLYSNHISETEFQKGVAKVVEYSKKSFQYLFVAMFSDYFENRKPIITAYLQQKSCSQNESLAEIKAVYNLHYQAALVEQKSRVI